MDFVASYLHFRRSHADGRNGLRFSVEQESEQFWHIAGYTAVWRALHAIRSKSKVTF